jgi:putative transposase
MDPKQKWALGRTTAQRHSTLQPITRVLKLDAHRLSSKQLAILEELFHEGKLVYNHLVADLLPAGGTPTVREWDSKNKTVSAIGPKGRHTARITTLGGHHKQQLRTLVQSQARGLATHDRKGRKAGRQCPVKELTSLPLGCLKAQHLCGDKVQVSPLGWVTIKGVGQLAGLELASAKLVKRETGYYLHWTGYRPWAPVPDSKLGMDKGIKVAITTSEGELLDYENPEHERLKHYQRELKRYKRGSRAHKRVRGHLRKQYRKSAHQKDDAAAKTVNKLLRKGIVYFQDDPLNGWKKRYGPKVQWSYLGRVKDHLKHQVAGGHAVMLTRWQPTTQLCPNCVTKNKIPLRVRLYSCECGYSLDRDVHAALNMIWLGEHPLSYNEIRMLPVGRGFKPDEAKLECPRESQEVVRPSTSIPRAVVDSGSGESPRLSPETLGFTPNVVHLYLQELKAYSFHP